ncbi:hypothetical protein EBZ80_19370 [bacterium]|nr:hypothetical protein [bacterium]
MDSFDDFLHRMRCSLHPQLRHYSYESLKDPDEYTHHLRYWNLPESFRKECGNVFQTTGTVGYFSWKSKCVFSFDCLTPPSPHAALLRNIFVPKEHRGQHCCTATLAEIVRVAESSATCIVAVVHPFEIYTAKEGIAAAIDALHRSSHEVAYVSNEMAQQAMNARLKKAGFRNCDLRDSMMDITIPLTNQWIFVPSNVDKPFLAGISDRFVNEAVDALGGKQTAI